MGNGVVIIDEMKNSDSEFLEVGVYVYVCVSDYIS